MHRVINCWTDSSVWPNPGRASIAFHVEETGFAYYEPLELCTNNRGELLAIRAALDYLLKNHRDARAITIYSDSEWSVHSLNGIYKKVKKNLDLIADIKEHAKSLNVIFKHCRSHCGIPGNEKADALAKQGLAQAIEKWGEYANNS
jgi:ribonuclease HI